MHINGLGQNEVQVNAAQSSSGFLDMISKTIGTVAQGAVTYALNRQAINAGGQPGMQYGNVAPVVAPDTTNRTMLIGAAIGLGALFFLMRKRR